MNATPQTTAETTQEPAHKFSTTQQVTPIYSEGVSQLIVGYPNSRFMLDSRPGVVSPDGKEVTHYLAAEVIMPTSALADLALRVADSLVQSKDQIGSFGEEWLNNLLAAIEKLQKPAPSGEK